MTAAAVTPWTLLHIAPPSHLVCTKELEDLLELVEEEDLFGRAGPGPATEEAVQYSYCGLGVLLDVLDDAVGQLLVVEADALGFMQRDERPDEELEVFLLEGYGEPVDDGTQDLQELPDAVVALGLVDEAVEYVGDGLADERPVGHELSVDPVEDGLEVVPLAGVLGVEELHELEAELLVNVFLGDLGVDL